MGLATEHQYAIKRQAWLEAVRFCGGVSAYSKCIKVLRSRLSNWVNQPELDIPYEYAILTEKLTGISVERLSPFTKDSNQVIRQLRSHVKFTLLPMIVTEIKQAGSIYIQHLNVARPMLVGTDSVLISGLNQLETYLKLGTQKTEVIIIDLEALLLGERTLKDFNINLVISEEIAIGLRLEQLIGNRQGQRNDLSLKPQEDKSPLLPTWREVKGRKDIWVAKILGYSTNTYYRAKRVCLMGSPILIDAMDNKSICISVAMQQLDLAKTEPNPL